MSFNRNTRGGTREDFEQLSRLFNCDRRVARNEASEPNCPSNTDTPPCKNDKSLAMVYPVQQAWCGIFDPEIALYNGTLFTELYKPFCAGSCRRKSENTEGCR